ncbi:MAG: DUF1778 domain-containing protein [Acetobacteraceae bacterium]|nr:DUF1778 domain-containing protein [Acetobacteraceae bacterium]
MATNKTSRLDARITPELREQLRYVATRQGRSVTDYVTTVLRLAIENDILEMDVIRLSREASERFAAALIDPPELTPTIKRAFAHHRRLVRSE